MVIKKKPRLTEKEGNGSHNIVLSDPASWSMLRKCVETVLSCGCIVCPEKFDGLVRYFISPPALELGPISTLGLGAWDILLVPLRTGIDLAGMFWTWTMVTEFGPEVGIQWWALVSNPPLSSGPCPWGTIQVLELVEVALCLHAALLSFLKKCIKLKHSIPKSDT